MTRLHQAWAEKQRARWIQTNPERFLRPDAHRFIRHDAHRFFKPGCTIENSAHGPRAFGYGPYDRKYDHARSRQVDGDAAHDVQADFDVSRARWHLAALRFELALLRFEQLRRKAGFNPDQQRVPAGNPDGGQWTNEGEEGENDPSIISDATPDNEAIPGAQYAQNRPPRGPILINGQWHQPTPAQAARLAVVDGQARDAIRRVQELDPNWRPTPSSYNTVEGLIRSHEADARQAQERASELARFGIGPGPFASESIPARGSERTYNAWERSEGLRIFSDTGCHTCGTTEPGTQSRNPVLDHQPPSALNVLGRPQRLHPQCLTCSHRQGYWIMRYRGGR